MHKYIIILLVSIGLFSSCFKEDEKVQPHEPGEVTTVVIPMTQYYPTQIYYNLGTNEFVGENDRSAFDLNFDCTDTSTIIRLNTADFAMAAETQYKKLEDVTDTIGLVWNYDKSDGNTDSLAINNWMSIDNGDTTYSNSVWVINRGITALGINLGLKKIQFYKYLRNRFYFRSSNMDDSEFVDSFVEKNDGYGMTQLSLSGESEALQTEPRLIEWDLNFTQYTTLLFTDEGLSYPYLVTGTLQNMNGLSVALDTTIAFNEIVLSDTSKFDFSTDQDKIGYEWKSIVGDVETGDFYYETNIDYTYVIRNNRSVYYKLRFISFYSPVTGEKGYPVFEYQLL